MTKIEKAKVVTAIIGIIVILVPMYFVVDYLKVSQCRAGATHAQIGIYTHTCTKEDK